MINKILLLAGAFGVGIYIATKSKTAQAATGPDMSTNVNPIPQGYKLATTVPSNVAKRCVDILSQPYGYEENITGSDGIDYLVRIEVHTWYGANPSKPPSPHKGSTVYVKI
jgi:hypothetical protein